MLHVILGVAGCFMGIFGILTNLYILIVLLWNKKTRTSSEWILLHLSWCGFACSLFHLCFLSPSILRKVFVLNYSAVTPLCDIVGSGLLVLQLVSVWSVCALSADRAIAIVYPLRYSQIATSRRIAVYFIAVWVLSLATMMTALSLVSFNGHHESSSAPRTFYTTTATSISREQSKYTTNIPKHPQHRTNSNNNNNNDDEDSNSNNNGSRAMANDDDYELIPPLTPPTWFNPSQGDDHRLHGDRHRLKHQNASSSSSSGGGGGGGARFNVVGDTLTPLPDDSTIVDDQDSQSQSSSNIVLPGGVQQNNNLSTSNSSSSNNNATYTSSSRNNNAKNTFMSDTVQMVQVTDGGGGEEDSENENLVEDGGGGYDGNETTTQVFRSMTLSSSELLFEFRPMLGICVPKVNRLSWFSVLWTTGWIVFILIAPVCTLLVCDLAVLSIARRQSHRILLAMTMVTITAQATVTRSKGMAPQPPTGLWVNNVPARSRACRAVCEDLTTLVLLHLPLILILIAESLTHDHLAPETLYLIGSLSLFATPSFNALLYGIRARPLRAAYKSYLRKRLTNTTLQHEIQNRLSPVDGSPRPSSRQGKSFRSSTPSPNSSPIQTPARRLSSNDLRPPPNNQLILTSSPSHDHIGRHHNRHHQHHHHHNFHDEEGGNNSTTRKVRSFLHIPSFPSQLDMQEFWSGLRRPNRSPTIVITHEIIGMKKDSSSSILGSPTAPDAEQRL